MNAFQPAPTDVRHLGLRSHPGSHRRALGTAMAAAALTLGAGGTLASPGAHGPNGEHLDAPAQGQADAQAAPRFEARSETFEAVGRLQGGEFSIFINRFATSEPVLQARVEVELGEQKAVAPFHADQGDYAVADPALLKALAQPGEHALVLSITAGTESDLLEGRLQVGPGQAATADAHAHDHRDARAGGRGWLLPAALIAAVAAVAGGLVLRARRRATNTGAGGAQ